VDESLFGVDVLMGSLGVEDVGVLGAAVGDADEVFVGGWFGDWDEGWFEGGGVGEEGGDEYGLHCLVVVVYSSLDDRQDVV